MIHCAITFCKSANIPHPIYLSSRSCLIFSVRLIRAIIATSQFRVLFKNRHYLGSFKYRWKRVWWKRKIKYICKLLRNILVLNPYFENNFILNTEWTTSFIGVEKRFVVGYFLTLCRFNKYKIIALMFSEKCL